MISLNPYLFFNGNCTEAMNFYKSCLGGDLFVMTYGEARGEQSPPAQKNRIIHASLKKGNFMLMASDTPEEAPPKGGNVYLYLHCESQSEIEQFFKALSEGGSVNQSLRDEFWGSHFGMLTDKYGFHWMLSYEKPKK